MASWSYSSVQEFDRAGNSLNYKVAGNHTDTNGVVTDGNVDPPDSVFSVGETLQVGPYTGTFAGTIDVGGIQCVVIYNDVDTAYLFSPQDLGPTYDALPPSKILSADDLNTGDFAVCFAAGTLIATPEGACAVETLAIGDLVTTADGRAVAVKWVGRQTLHKLFTPADRFEPVRVAAGAFGGGLPHADLVLTSDHALILDGLAVNAGALVNGTTITRVPAADLPERVTYYHVETEGHEVVLANGVASETFVDYIGRRAFDNHGEYITLYGDEPVIAEMPLPRISSRRQLPADLRARFGIADFAEDVTADAMAFLAAQRVA